MCGEGEALVAWRRPDFAGDCGHGYLVQMRPGTTVGQCHCFSAAPSGMPKQMTDHL